MKPWDAYLNTSLHAIYLNTYLVRQNNMDRFKARKRVANLTARVLSDLNKQTNGQAMREAQGLHGFELALQDFYAMLAQNRNKGDALRPLLGDYLNFLKQREALGLITFDVPNTAKLADKAVRLGEGDSPFMKDGKLMYIGNPACAAKMKAYIAGPVVNAVCGAQAAKDFYDGVIDMTDEEWLALTNLLIEDMSYTPQGTRSKQYKLTYANGKTVTFKPLDALKRVVKEVGHERIFEHKIMAKTDTPLIINIIYQAQKEYYTRIGETRYWLYDKGGTQNLKIIQKIIACFPGDPIAGVEKA